MLGPGHVIYSEDNLSANVAWISRNRKRTCTFADPPPDTGPSPPNFQRVALSEAGAYRWEQDARWAAWSCIATEVG